MSRMYVISGPCGCGKTTLAAAFAQQLAREGRAVYLIHGDDFHAGFVGDAVPWPEILRFNWECILSMAGKALQRGMDVVIDYVVEDEWPALARLAREHSADLQYTTLTASEEALRQRLLQRGDAQLTERSLFLKAKLERMPENQGRLLDNTALTIPEALSRLRQLLQTGVDNPPPHGVS